MLFLAGVYQAEPEGGRFVIITAPADETVRPIHDRMPVRIPESLISAWLSDAESAKELLDTATVPLRRKQAVEQMSFGHVSRGSAGEYQADERAGVAQLSWRVSGR